MNTYKNRRKESFLKKYIDIPSLLDDKNDLTLRCKFNFSYFDSSQDAGQDFKDWSHKQLYELLDKIKYFGTRHLDYWQTQRVGAGGLKVLEIYGAFPKKSDFPSPEMAMGNQKNSDRTKSKIIEAAGQLFAVRGIKGVTVRDSAQKAGTHLSALSYHFGSKENLYREILLASCRSATLTPQERKQLLRLAPETALFELVKGWLMNSCL